jgi:hypothetical protein
MIITPRFITSDAFARYGSLTMSMNVSDIRKPEALSVKTRE